MNWVRILALCVALVAPSLAWAVTTAKIAVNNVAWLDMGAGPLALTPMGKAVFAIGDVTPTIQVGQGFLLTPNKTQRINTTSHVWTAAVDTTSTWVFAVGIAGGGAVASVWNATDAAVMNVTLSNGGATVTGPTVSGFVTVRGTVSHSSGKYYIELNGSTSGNNQLGVASASFSGNRLGYVNYSNGLGYSANQVTAGFTANYNTSDYSGDEALAVNFDDGEIYWRVNGIWVNGSNPATRTLPITSFVPATVGALFPAISPYNVGEVWTIRGTSALMIHAIPAGYQAWDGL